MQVHGQHRNVLKWAFYSALGTLGSRFVGLAREVVMAALFGTGIVADAFSAAFRFPNVLRRVFGEGGLLVVFLPRYSQERIELGDEEANILASSVAVVLGIVMAVVILLGELTAPYLAWVFAHGWIDQPEKFALTVHLLRMLYPFVGFIAFATWAAAILNSHKKFFLPSLAPAFFNLGWLSGALVTLIRYREADPHLQATIVAAGVLFGGLLQFVVQLPMMKKIGFRFSPDVRRKWAAILEIGRLLLPALAAMAIVEINFMVDVFLASFLP
ncbi:MAG TPA: murein biosynthesis integral membrane protein MurJ, partial [candidate division Zixibacteria bacterium]|nr:murein biosynthesis integral membrane protein MurJ [candidate division Zixibacteria bacterium]